MKLKAKFILIFLIVICLFGKVENIAAQTSEKAREVVKKAAQAMGGEEKLRSLKAIHYEGLAYLNHLTDSEHQGEPFIPDFQQIAETRDLSSLNSQKIIGSQSATGSKSEVVYTTIGNTTVVTNSFTLPSGEVQKSSRVATADDDWRAISPERILLAALDSGSLKYEGVQPLYGIPQNVVSFKWQNYPVRIFFNSYNNFPVAVELIRDYPYDVARGAWGDVTVRYEFTNWSLEANGIHYPEVIITSFNGKHLSTLVIGKVEMNPAVSPEIFKSGEATQAGSKPVLADDIPLGLPAQPPFEITSDITHIPGSWHTTLVRQPDGIVVIEAPISNGYSKKVIAEANRRFPDVPIKAVITTTNFWWHIAGLREYAARGIPIYALDLNRPLIEELLNSPHRLHPDALAQTGQKPEIYSISKPTVIGTGANQLIIYPARTATAQMQLVYFPARRLLYTAELAQPFGPNGSFIFPHDLSAITKLVEQNHLTVRTVIGMHVSPTPYEKIIEAIIKTGGSDGN